MGERERKREREREGEGWREPERGGKRQGKKEGEREEEEQERERVREKEGKMKRGREKDEFGVPHSYPACSTEEKRIERECAGEREREKGIVRE